MLINIYKKSTTIGSDKIFSVYTLVREHEMRFFAKNKYGYIKVFDKTIYGYVKAFNSIRKIEVWRADD